ncbi:MAG: haloalkane dehalogenase [Acidimicrobiia bacterium]
MTIKALRTDDGRFDCLPDWPYRPHYIETLVGYPDLRMHYIDEGPSDGELFLCLHGQPTWAYLYRKMIPVFLESGARVVAPDFFGFGRSDKPVDNDVYTWDFHRGALVAFIEALDLKDFTLVVQDWGGLLGLSLGADLSERISGLIVMNTAFAVGGTPGQGFLDWRDYVARTPDLAVDRLMQRSCPQLSDAEAAAYGAPFPDITYKAGVRTFPALVPTNSDMDGVEISKRALRWWSEEFDGRSFMAIGANDPVLAGVMPWVRERIRGCTEPLVLDDAGHFVQEWGDQVARAALAAWDG